MSPSWARLAGTTTLAIVVTAAGLALAATGLLAIVIRQLPDASDAATDLVAELAVALEVPPDRADDLAGRVVAGVDDSLLGGTMSTADQVRAIVRLLPAVPGAVIAAAVTLAGRGRRVRWLGWAGVVSGGALVALTWLLWWAGNGATEPLAGEAGTVGVRYVAGLIGPGWVIGGVTAAAGLGLMLIGRTPPQTPPG